MLLQLLFSYHIDSVLIVLEAGRVDHDRVIVAAAAGAVAAAQAGGLLWLRLLLSPWDAALLRDAAQGLPARHGLVVAAGRVELHVGRLGAAGGAAPWKITKKSLLNKQNRDNALIISVQSQSKTSMKC